jgi:hypothetical protein
VGQGELRGELQAKQVHRAVAFGFVERAWDVGLGGRGAQEVVASLRVLGRVVRGYADGRRGGRRCRGGKHGERERERERESLGRSTGTGLTSCGVDDRSASLYCITMMPADVHCSTRVYSDARLVLDVG